MAILATELRIGNLVNENFTIESIDEKFVEMDSAIQDRHLKKVPLEALHPIPLTEEWLQRLGFTEMSEKNYSLFLNDFDFTINVYYTSSGGNWFVHLNDNRLNFNSVHDLQNLYFALTGTDFEIK